MKNLLSGIGLDDGSGNVSHTRVVNLLVAACWLVSKFYNAHLTHTPITWDSTDLEILGVIGGISIGKTVAENSTKPNPPTP
jgi:hypothetical protein